MKVEPLTAYTRDFSFYMRSHGGNAGKYHAMGTNGGSKCGRAALLDTISAISIERVPEILRCKVCWKSTP